MKNLQTRNDLLSFQDFVLEKNINDILAMVEGEISELEASQELNEEELIEEGAFGQLAGWIFLSPYMMLRQTMRFFKKRIKIKRELKKSDLDSAGRAALKKDLKNLKYEELKAKEKMDKQKEKVNLKKKQVSSSATPEERAKAAKQKEKADQKYDALKAKFDKEKEKFHGLEL